MKRDMQQYAEDRLAEMVRDAVSGFVDADEVTSLIEDLEGDFDGDSYCPYYSQQVDVIDAYERDFGRDAEDLCDSGQTFKASEWQQAQTAYAYAVAYCAFGHYFDAAKRELIDGIGEFMDALNAEFPDTDCTRIAVNFTSAHGWAAHDRELSDGTMIFESGQLDGMNGMERNINGAWVSTCF